LCTRDDGHDARCHFGGRGEGAGQDVEQDFHLGEPFNQHGKATIGFAVRRRGQSLGNLSLKHQRQIFIVADPLKPAEEQRGGDIVRQVRDDPSRRIRELCWIKPQRITLDQCEALRIGGGQLAQGSETAWVTLDRDDPARTGCKQRPCQAARAGADLDDCCMIEVPGGAGYPARQVEIEEKILPEALARDDAIAGDDVA
jgi:hypothetical protein